MQVPARMRQCHLTGLRRMLKVMMTAARADEAPAIGFQFANNITRVLAHERPVTKIPRMDTGAIRVQRNARATLPEPPRSPPRLTPYVAPAPVHHRSPARAARCLHLGREHRACGGLGLH